MFEFLIQQPITSLVRLFLIADCWLISSISHTMTTFQTIAHRLNTILDSDLVLVLSEGKVVEFDNPDKLAAMKGSVFSNVRGCSLKWSYYFYMATFFIHSRIDAEGFWNFFWEDTRKSQLQQCKFTSLVFVTNLKMKTIDIFQKKAVCVKFELPLRQTIWQEYRSLGVAVHICRASLLKRLCRSGMGEGPKIWPLLQISHTFTSFFFSGFSIPIKIYIK